MPALEFPFSISPAFQDINAYNGEEPTEKLPFPIIDDKNRDLAIQLGMLDPAENDEKGMPVTAHVAFVLVLIINQNCPSSTQLPLAGTLMRFSE